MRRLRHVLSVSPWLILATIVGCSVLLALVLLRLDHILKIDPDPSQPWLYGGTADSAISLLSAVASSAITVAGVVFSATFVTMQLASSQYTPRVIDPLSRRWYVQVVLGIFMGTFIYSIVVLRSVRPATETSPEFVPVLSVTFCVIYSLIAVGVMLYYTSYSMRSLQPSFLIDSAAGETVDILRKRLVRLRERPADTDAPDLRSLTGEPWNLQVEMPGFVQRVQVDRMLAVAQQCDLLVRLDRPLGSYVLRGEALLSVWPLAACTADVQAALRETTVLGAERTADQDIEYGIRRVADILLKALSPAINDPTTAEYALNRLCDLIVLLASGEDGMLQFADDRGRVRVLWPPDQFDRCVQTAFGQLRFYIGRDVHLMVYSLDLLQRTTTLIQPAMRGPILEEAAKLRSVVLETVSDRKDHDRIRRAGAWIDDAGLIVAE
jgi:uncharacterized membrane protein